jgi:hypothetical protein
MGGGGGDPAGIRPPEAKPVKEVEGNIRSLPWRSGFPPPGAGSGETLHGRSRRDETLHVGSLEEPDSLLSAEFLMYFPRIARPAQPLTLLFFREDRCPRELYGQRSNRHSLQDLSSSPTTAPSAAVPRSCQAGGDPADVSSNTSRTKWPSGLTATSDPHTVRRLLFFVSGFRPYIFTKCKPLAPRHQELIDLLLFVCSEFFLSILFSVCFVKKIA